ncbi:unnamed protein product [Enterobius vermicularis]|uniref:Uncharacterized protein n=1 Tax=Enterobius vermicularis TaxID=51028 RepID=A0A0N4V960_ENTVE|nr:unnamed protein product [Enterobius vermicularis]
MKESWIGKLTFISVFTIRCFCFIGIVQTKNTDHSL